MSMSKKHLIKYTFHGHEKTRDNLFFICMLVDKEKEWGRYNMEIIIKKVNKKRK
jgi:hypothetical protein